MTDEFNKAHKAKADLIYKAADATEITVANKIRYPTIHQSWRANKDNEAIVANKANTILGANNANVIIKTAGVDNAKESNKLDEAIALCTWQHCWFR